MIAGSGLAVNCSLQPTLALVRFPFYRQGRQLLEPCHVDQSVAEVRFVPQSLPQSHEKAALCSWRKSVLEG